MHEVTVEVLLLSLLPDGRLGCRSIEGLLPAALGPDATALALAGLPEGEDPNGTVLHSTSWRPDGAGIVLTYAVLPDPDPGRGEVRTVDPDTALVSSGDLVLPSPDDVPPGAVAAHAARHLSMLTRTDSLVQAVAQRHPRLWDAVLAHTPDVAGRLGDPFRAGPVGERVRSRARPEMSPASPDPRP